MAAAVLTREELWARFTARAEALGTLVRRATSEEEAAGLLAGAPAEIACTHAVGERFPAVAGRCGGVASRERPAPALVGVAAFAVAETGSVLLEESRADRAACFLAERLWLLVPAARIVPTLDAALAEIGQRVREGARYLTLMSGPSRTADIERTLTVGVHGPRELTILVLGAGP